MGIGNKHQAGHTNRRLFAYRAALLQDGYDAQNHTFLYPLSHTTFVAPGCSGLFLPRRAARFNIFPSDLQLSLAGTRVCRTRLGNHNTHYFGYPGSGRTSFAVDGCFQLDKK